MGDNLKQVRYYLHIVAARATSTYMVFSYKSEIVKRLNLIIVRYVYQKDLFDIWELNIFGIRSVFSHWVRIKKNSLF